MYLRGKSRDMVVSYLMDTEEDEEADKQVIGAVFLSAEASNRSTWVHDINLRRPVLGSYNLLINELRLDNDRFTQYLRMSVDQFDALLSKVEPVITKRNTTFRQPLSPPEKLAITLRYLATGESYRSLAFSFRVGASTISMLVPEVCEAIWTSLVDDHMAAPSTTEEWKNIAKEFEKQWNFPHCCGAIDGKHIVIQAPNNSGSLYFNYKSTFSIVLMAVVDANYRFITIDVGSYGKNNDSGIYQKSAFGRALSEGKLKLPEPESLPNGAQLGPMPYVFVGDEAFPLSTHMMRPYSRANTAEEEKVFNYRLSRARRIVENAFGILAARWRVFHSVIQVFPDTCVKVVKAACILHNFLQTSNTPVFQDQQGGNATQLLPLVRRGNRNVADALDVRHSFKQYFNEIGVLPWQLDVVRKGKFIVET